MQVAVKLESLDTDDPRLDIEYKRYASLNDTGYTPRVYWLGPFASLYLALVMDCLGTSLDQVRKRYKSRHMPLGAVVSMGERLVAGVECMHSHHFIHRDIKPNNMALAGDRGKHGDVYLIDFGSSKLFQERKKAHEEASRRARGNLRQAGRRHQRRADRQHNISSVGGDGSGGDGGGEDDSSLFSHIRYREERGFIGTVRYASLAALMGKGTERPPST